MLAVAGPRDPDVFVAGGQRGRLADIPAVNDGHGVADSSLGFRLTGAEGDRHAARGVKELAVLGDLAADGEGLADIALICREVQTDVCIPLQAVGRIDLYVAVGHDEGIVDDGDVAAEDPPSGEVHTLGSLIGGQGDELALLGVLGLGGAGADKHGVDGLFGLFEQRSVGLDQTVDGAFVPLLKGVVVLCVRRLLGSFVGGGLGIPQQIGGCIQHAAVAVEPDDRVQISDAAGLGIMTALTFAGLFALFFGGGGLGDRPLAPLVTQRIDGDVLEGELVDAVLIGKILAAGQDVGYADPVRDVARLGAGGVLCLDLLQLVQVDGGIALELDVDIQASVGGAERHTGLGVRDGKGFAADHLLAERGAERRASDIIADAIGVAAVPVVADGLDAVAVGGIAVDADGVAFEHLLGGDPFAVLHPLQ